MGANFDVFVDILRRDFIPQLEIAWSQHLANFSYAERVQGINWLIDDRLLPMALESNPHGIEFAIIAPKAMRILKEEFLASKKVQEI